MYHSGELNLWTSCFSIFFFLTPPPTSVFLSLMFFLIFFFLVSPNHPYSVSLSFISPPSPASLHTFLIFLFELLTSPLVPSGLWNIDQASLSTCLPLFFSLNYLPLKKNNPYLSSFYSSTITPFHPSLALCLPISPSTFFVKLAVIFPYCCLSKPKKATWSWSSPDRPLTPSPLPPPLYLLASLSLSLIISSVTVPMVIA